MKSKINYHGYFEGNFGIAEATRLNALALEKSGVAVNIINYSPDMHQRITENIPEADVNIFHININSILDFFTFNQDINLIGKYNIIYWAWEFPEITKESFQILNSFDELWVPSNFCVNIFTNYTSIPVLRIPHPIDILENSKDFKKEDYQIPDKARIHLTIFDALSSPKRKNPQATIESFLKIHDNDNNNILIVKTHHLEKSQESQKIIENYKDISNIIIISEHFSKSKLHSLIQQCDVLISLHGSEGFGLTIAEAMAYGKIVIGTGYSGNLDFMNINNSFLVKYDFTTIPNIVNLSNDDLTIAKPDIEDATKKILFIKENFDRLDKLKSRAKEEIETNFSLDRIGSILKKRLEYITSLDTQNKKASQNSQNIYHISEIKDLQKRINYLEKTIYNKARKKINSFIKKIKNKK